MNLWEIFVGWETMMVDQMEYHSGDWKEATKEYLLEMPMVPSWVYCWVVLKESTMEYEREASMVDLSE